MQDAGAVLDGLRAGRPEAFRILHERLHDPVLRRGLRVMGSSSDAHDVVAGVFVDFVDRHVHGFRGTTWTALRAYLEAAVISRGRRLRARRRQLDSAEGPLKPAEDSAVRDVWLLRALETCLGRLSDRQRELVRLKYGAHKDNPEIAALLGVSRAAVSQGLVRTPDGALHRLRRCLEEHSPPEAP